MATEFIYFSFWKCYCILVACHRGLWLWRGMTGCMCTRSWLVVDNDVTIMVLSISYSLVRLDGEYLRLDVEIIPNILCDFLSENMMG